MRVGTGGMKEKGAGEDRKGREKGEGMQRGQLWRRKREENTGEAEEGNGGREREEGDERGRDGKERKRREERGDGKR